MEHAGLALVLWATSALTVQQTPAGILKGFANETCTGQVIPAICILTVVRYEQTPNAPGLPHGSVKNARLTHCVTIWGTASVQLTGLGRIVDTMWEPVMINVKIA